MIMILAIKENPGPVRLRSRSCRQVRQNLSKRFAPDPARAGRRSSNDSIRYLTIIQNDNRARGAPF